MLLEMESSACRVQLRLHQGHGVLEQVAHHEMFWGKSGLVIHAPQQRR